MKAPRPPNPRSSSVTTSLNVFSAEIDADAWLHDLPKVRKVLDHGEETFPGRSDAMTL